MTDRRFSDLNSADDDGANETQRTDWIIGLLSALVLAVVLYAAVFGLNANDRNATRGPDAGAFSLAQLDGPASVATSKHKN
jgi:hypothetical protein